MSSLNITEILKDLENVDKSEEKLNEISILLARETCNKNVTIHSVVESLGTLLVNSAPEKRKLGTLILSEILENLPNDFLTATELSFISIFYADRLKDNHQVIPAVLRGILVLVQMKNLPEGAPHKLLNALFENVPCQQQQFEDRQNVYSIFKELLNRRTTEMKALGLDFVLGVIQAMDSERDPKNLYLLFKWLPQFLQTVTLGTLAEEMFNVISCYFPIDFRAPPQNPDAITRDHLAYLLCPCLCAIPEFAEFCLPLIIDKLNSSLKIAKCDSLDLLTESCKTFDVSIYEQFSHDIWDVLQKEALNSNDPEIEKASLNAIRAVIHRLATSENNSFFKEIVNNLYESLKGNLRPDTKLFLPSSQILLAVATASKQSCNDIVQNTIALLLNQFNLTKDTNQQEILFTTLTDFVTAYMSFFEVTDITQIKVLEEIPVLCLQSVTYPDNGIRLNAFKCLGKIAKTLPHTVRKKVYEMFKIELVQKQPEKVRYSFLICFKTFSSFYLNEILDIINSFVVDINNLKALKLYLDALCIFISEIYFFDKILPIILSYTVNENIELTKIAIKCLRQLLEDNSDFENFQEYLFFEYKLINKITVWILEVIKENKSDVSLVEDVSTIIKIVVGYQTKENQQIIINSYINELFNCYKLNGHIRDKIIILLAGLLMRIRPEVTIPEKYQLIQDLLQISPSIQENIYIYACMLIANLINKCPEDENFVVILTEIEKYIENSLQNSKNDLHIKNLIQLISWITKSLIIRGSNASNLWIDMLILLLDKYEDVGKSFRFIMDDSFDCLSQKSFCTNRLLYRQKFFAYVCKKLSSSYDTNKPNHLVALGYLLQLAPQQVVILYFKETLRLLVLCLELCKVPEVLCAVLTTLNRLIITKEPYLENHIDDLLPRFLNLAKFEISMEVRITALNCLKEIPSVYPVYKLLPHKQEILFGLAITLDDRKRLVRKHAVEARSRWFLLDAPV